MDLAEPLPLVQIENNDGNYAINVVPNLAQDELATGPRYAPNDIKCNSANFLGFNTSGVLGKMPIKLKHYIYLTFATFQF